MIQLSPAISPMNTHMIFNFSYNHRNTADHRRWRVLLVVTNCTHQLVQGSQRVRLSKDASSERLICDNVVEFEDQKIADLNVIKVIESD